MYIKINMEYLYRKETSVKPLLKWLDWDHSIRNHIFTGESRLGFLATEATWSDSKILKCKDLNIRYKFIFLYSY